VVSILAIVIHLSMVAITVAKGKYRTALIGTFTPFVAWVGAIRLARPSSSWATRRYDDDKMARARERAERFDERFGATARQMSDRVAGAPEAHPDR
jgi:hypothetical protein